MDHCKTIKHYWDLRNEKLEQDSLFADAKLQISSMNFTFAQAVVPTVRTLQKIRNLQKI